MKPVFQPAQRSELLSDLVKGLEAQLHEERTVARGLAVALILSCGGDQDDEKAIDAVIADARAEARSAIAALARTE